MWMLAECKVNKRGDGYKGTVSTTRTGRQCQAWSSRSPHKPYRTVKDRKFPDGSRAAARNYCRSPINKGRGPWCYTMDSSKRWEKCDVQLCNEPYRKFLSPGILFVFLLHVTYLIHSCAVFYELKCEDNYSFVMIATICAIVACEVSAYSFWLAH